MCVGIKSAGLIGGLLAVIALVIALLKQIIALVSFLMFAIKASLFVGFIALFLVIGFLAIRTWQQRNRERRGED